MNQGHVRYITFKQEAEILAKMQTKLDQLVADEYYEDAQFLLETMNEFKQEMIDSRMTRLEKNPIDWVKRPIWVSYIGVKRNK
jgi:hypothetical protein